MSKGATLSLIGNTDPEGPSWPTLLAMGIVVALVALLLLIGSAHVPHRHAQHCVVVCKPISTPPEPSSP